SRRDGHTSGCQFLTIVGNANLKKTSIGQGFWAAFKVEKSRLFWQDKRPSTLGATMSLSEKDVQYVAKLARLEVTDQEVAKYTQQLANILQYVEQLNKLDTANVEP